MAGIEDAIKNKSFMFNYDPQSIFRGNLKPKKTILTNLHTDLDYNELKKKLPKKVIPAYDGLSVSL